MDILKKIIDDTITKDETKKILKIFGNGYSLTYEDIGERVGKRKEAVEVIIKNSCEKISKNDKWKKKILPLFPEKESLKDGEHVYIDCREISRSYPRVIAKIIGFERKYKIKNKIFVFTDENLHLPKKELLKVVKDEGFPIPLNPPAPNTGVMDRVSFLYALSENEWITDKEKKNIIGNKKSTFFYNACLFQKANIVSIFDIVSLYAENELIPYLEENGAIDMHKINLKIYRTIGNSKKAKERCDFNIAQRQNISKLGYTIYDFTSWLKANNAYSEKGDKSPESEGIKLLYKKVKAAENSIRKQKQKK